MNNPDLPIIGSVEYVQIKGEDVQIPAKTDTGADSSSIWASDFRIEDDNSLSFVLFNETSPLFSGVRHYAKEFKAAHVRSSNGQVQVRYRVDLEMTVRGVTFTTTFTLNDRSRNRFPLLIGRHAVSGRFLVDCAQEAFPRPKGKDKSDSLTEELRRNPKAFHQKYLPSTQAVNREVE